MDTIKDRLRLFLEYRKTSQSAFERTMQLSHGYVSNMRKGFSPKVRSLIARRYPELNMDWLLTGRGEMLSNGNGTNPVTDTERARYQDMLKWRDGRIVTLENLVLELTKQIKELNETVI